MGSAGTLLTKLEDSNGGPKFSVGSSGGSSVVVDTKEPS